MLEDIWYFLRYLSLETTTSTTRRLLFAFFYVFFFLLLYFCSFWTSFVRGWRFMLACFFIRILCFFFYQFSFSGKKRLVSWSLWITEKRRSEEKKIVFLWWEELRWIELEWFIHIVFCCMRWWDHGNKKKFELNWGFLCMRLWWVGSCHFWENAWLMVSRTWIIEILVPLFCRWPVSVDGVLLDLGCDMGTWYIARWTQPRVTYSNGDEIKSCPDNSFIYSFTYLSTPPLPESFKSPTYKKPIPSPHHPQVTPNEHPHRNLCTHHHPQ